MRADHVVVIPPGHQVIVDTGLDLQIPSGLYGEVQSSCNLSQFEPAAAPGLVLPEHRNILMLLANLHRHPINVKRHQTVAFLHLIPVSEVAAIHDFGDLYEFRLESNDSTTPSVHSFIPREHLSGLTEGQKDQVLALFKIY